MDTVPETELTPVQRWVQIVETAQQALVTEAMADAAWTDCETDLWLDYDEMCARIVRLLTEDGSLPMRNAIRQALSCMEAEAPIPQAWADLISAYRRAQVAREGLAPGLHRDVRDHSVKAYVTACDDMVAQMGRLSLDHTLGRITLLLSGGVAA